MNEYSIDDLRPGPRCQENQETAWQGFRLTGPVLDQPDSRALQAGSEMPVVMGLRDCYVWPPLD